MAGASTSVLVVDHRCTTAPAELELCLREASALDAEEQVPDGALALLTVGTASCWLTGKSSVLLNVRGGEDAIDDAVVNFLVVPAEAGLVCCMLLENAQGASTHLLDRLRSYCTLLEWRLSASRTAGMSTVPPHDSIASDLLVSRAAQGAVTFHRAMLVTASAVGAVCTAVSAGVTAIMPLENPLPQLPDESGERLSSGLETARVSFQRLSGVPRRAHALAIKAVSSLS